MVEDVQGADSRGVEEDTACGAFVEQLLIGLDAVGPRLISREERYTVTQR